MLNIHSQCDIYRGMVVQVSDQAGDCDIRGRILDAALQRFAAYGFGKTTMAELAADTRMSAANLYRYFENKHDIAAACAQRCIMDQTESLRAVVDRADISATQKLEAFVAELLRHTNETYESTPHINELVELIVNIRPDIVHAKTHSRQSMLAEILKEGCEAGEFDVADVRAAAEALYESTKIFHVPIFMGLYDYAYLQQLVGKVVNLLLNGLAKR